MEQILDAPTDVKQLTYAGFWIRVGAALIDGIILGTVNALLNFMFLGGMATASPESAVGTMMLSFGVIVILNIIYVCGFESSSKQATPGKMAVGIKVGDANGEQISFMNALGRYLSKILSALILYIGFMMVGWDDKNQGLHDKIAGTYVFFAK